MKTTDLMIGNWILVPDHQDAPATIPAKITMINDCNALTVFLDGGDCIFNGEEVEPIPLTPEILEKNGYTCKRSLDAEIISYNWTSPDRRVTLNDQNGSPWFCIIRSEGMMEEVMIGITYVHELQHALKLCGIEKEIVL